MDRHLPPLIRALLGAAAYDHPVERIELIETHISWIVLTGALAYKIKKPVDLGFLDFTSLALRRHYCEEELRLNRRLAPQLYIAVVAITGTAEHPRLGGPGQAIEYAVRMRQFDPSLQLDRLLARHEIDKVLFDGLAARMASFHATTERASPDDAWGKAETIFQPVIENFVQIAGLPDAVDDAGALDALRRWSEQRHRQLVPLFEQRHAQGCVRECHGDLHLANIALIDGEAVPFDCLEFSPALRWVDTISEIAFLIMDLDFHRRNDLALAFLNRYLHHSGDYAGLACLDYYLVYRALVRAKVACIRATQATDSDERIGQIAHYRRHLDLASAYTRRHAPVLYITRGLSGCGKTTLTEALIAPCRAIRIRSDVERKRLHGIAPEARSGSAPGAGMYSAAAGRQTYQRLAELSRLIVDAGYSVIVDATFLRRIQRRQFRQLATDLGIPFVILDLQADQDCLRARIRRRHADSRDASEADIAILEMQIRDQETLEDDELADVVSFDSGRSADSAALLHQLRMRRPELGISGR